MFESEEPTTWLSIPRWLWRLIIPSGAALVAFTLFLAIPAFTLIVIADLGANAWVEASRNTPHQISPPPPGVTNYVDPDACPANFGALASGQDISTFSGTCSCPSTEPGSIWGTDIYTTDSSICEAARHAGLVDANGGMVEVKAAPGCSSYKGTTRNGVTTSDWESYGSSFYFPAVSQGVCASTGPGLINPF